MDTGDSKINSESNSGALEADSSPELPTLYDASPSKLPNVEFFTNGDAFDVKGIYEHKLEDVITNYVRYYATGEGHTAKAKRYDLFYFLKYLTRPQRVTVLVRDWTLQETKDFIDSRLSKGEAPSTVSRRLATIKHFGRTLADRVPGFINPAKEAKAPSYKQVKPQGLTVEIIELLKQGAIALHEEKKNSFSSFRNLVLLELLLGTGLRADEVRLLKRSQLSEDNTWLKNVKTKGKKFRDVYIHQGLSPLLSEYLLLSQVHLTQSHQGASAFNQQTWLKFPVFISLRNAVIDNPDSFTLAPKTLWRVVSEIGKKSSLLTSEDVPNLHPHKLRHAFAHGLLDSSNDIRLVAQALGHSDVRTTMRYTERSKDELRKAIEISRTNGKI